MAKTVGRNYTLRQILEDNGSTITTDIEIRYPQRKPDYFSVRLTQAFSRVPVSDRPARIMDHLTRVEGMTLAQARERFAEIERANLNGPARVAPMPTGGTRLPSGAWQYAVDPQTLRKAKKKPSK